MRMMRRLILVICLLAPVCGCAGMLRGRDADDVVRFPITERFAIPKGGDVIVLPVALQGKTYQFMLDTGASSNVYDTALPIGDPVREQTIHGSDGDARLKMYKAPEAHLGVL